MKKFWTTVALGSLLTGSLLAQGSSRPLYPGSNNDAFRLVQMHPGASYLGIRLADIDAERAKKLKVAEDRGVEVTGVEEGSPADTAGIKPGDVLLSYNGENVLGAEQLVRLVNETPQGRKVKLQYSRDGKVQTATVTTAARRARNDFPAGFPGVEFPDVRTFSMPDVPTPMMVWKSALFGMSCEPINNQLAQYFGVKAGVLVRSVDKDSPADKAGIKAGDVLIGIGDRSLSSPRELASFTRNLRRTDKPVSVTLVRNHKDLSLTITPSDRDAQE
jgi:serine protease Do